MKPSNFVIFYVQDTAASTAFYAKLLGMDPIEQSPGFAMFVTPEGFKLGLWQRQSVIPPSDGQIGGTEVMFECASNDELDAIHRAWATTGATILQTPAQMVFGYTFTAADPDGHRLRVYRRNENPV
ncbi:VOC family protein [Pannonibacter phragmitetus]|uniref:VOC family protein n=1 Tax=Pannonibacter phragmitetus TaxID=121719 RepID=UPI003D2F1168